MEAALQSLRSPAHPSDPEAAWEPWKQVTGRICSLLSLCSLVKNFYILLIPFSLLAVRRIQASSSQNGNPQATRYQSRVGKDALFDHFHAGAAGSARRAQLCIDSDHPLIRVLGCHPPLENEAEED